MNSEQLDKWDYIVDDTLGWRDQLSNKESKFIPSSVD